MFYTLAWREDLQPWDIYSLPPPVGVDPHEVICFSLQGLISQGAELMNAAGVCSLLSDMDHNVGSGYHLGVVSPKTSGL